MPFVSPSSPQVPAPTVRFRVIAWLVIALVRLFRWRIRTVGIGNVPAEQGAVVTWNHVSHIDFVCTVWDVYRQLGRPVRYVPSVSWGSQRLTTTGRRARRREAFGIPVEIAFGEPLCPGPDDDPVEVTADLHHRTTQLLHRVQDRYPDGAPAGAWWVPARLGGGAPAPPADQVAVRRRPGDAA